MKSIRSYVDETGVDVFVMPLGHEGFYGVMKTAVVQFLEGGARYEIIDQQMMLSDKLA